MTLTQRPVTMVVSDLHMGAADRYDDFVYQNDEFVSFVDELTASTEGRHGRIELLINGDFLELAQVNPDAYQLGSSKFWCSESESLLKLRPILDGHSKVFAAIKRFQEARNQCTLFAGNHDVELYWPKVQALLTAAAGNLRFELEHLWYSRYDGALRLSHGHMFDPGNSFKDWSNPFLQAPDGLRLEMCAGTMFMVKFVNWMEHEYPFADNVHPNWRLATILWKEAKDGLALAAWLFGRFAARHPKFTLGADEDDALAHMSKMGDWVVTYLQSNAPFRRKVTDLWNEVYGASVTPNDIVSWLATPDEVERFVADVLVRVSPEQWLPVFDGVRPSTLQIAKSGRWKSKEALRKEASLQFEEAGTEIVTIGHTHEYDTFSNGSQRYYNTGSWTRSLPWSKDKDLTLERLKDESWFPYNLLYLRVEQQGSGKLASEMGTRGKST
jgi:UDP-2,3-diacylglucosamine pyrophosphatase LpxH